MNLLGPVSDIMTTELITVSENDPVSKIEEIFKENKIHHIPVIDKGKLIGLISKSDYLFFKRGFNDDRVDERLDSFRMRVHTVKEIMTTKLATLESNAKINVALEIFKENLFHAIPIVEDEKLIGIVTTLDVIKHLADAVEVNKKYVI